GEVGEGFRYAQVRLAPARLTHCERWLGTARRALDQGQPAKHESSAAKAFVAEAVNRVVDNAIQVCGATGISGDTLLARMMNELRPFRIYDGPTETHLWSIARRTLRAHAARAAQAAVSQ
ncbi:MAG TPA: acyl-CoA dehydrogenase family protein, partial [Solirubrobacterales bacterium]|nr:acyl-CoA dehydrogenase family protein [Solirubrobacterales bacterium]